MLWVSHLFLSVLNSSIQNIQFPKAKHGAQHSSHMCGGIKALKLKGVRTTLRFAYHGCENLAHMAQLWAKTAAPCKIRQVKRTQMVATARFTIRVFVIPSHCKESRKPSVARKDTLWGSKLSLCCHYWSAY